MNKEEFMEFVSEFPIIESESTTAPLKIPDITKSEAVDVLSTTSSLIVRMIDEVVEVIADTSIGIFPSMPGH